MKKRLEKRGGMFPIKSSVNLALEKICHANNKNAYSKNFDKGFYYLKPDEIFSIGQIVHFWEKMVGEDVSSNIFPYRLIKGKLILLCSDSQWLQTLNFLKEKIIEKVRQNFPKIHIEGISGKIGQIPADRNLNKNKNWPDWEKEEPFEIPEIPNGNLAGIIKRSMMKTRARLKGINQQGYSLCARCLMVLVSKKDSFCSVCFFKSRQNDFSKVRALIDETPWLSNNEVKIDLPSIQNLEIDLIRSELLGESIKMIELLGSLMKIEFDPSLMEKIRFEMIRVIILKTGLLPVDVDLFNPAQKTFFEPGWEGILNLSQKEETC